MGEYVSLNPYFCGRCFLRNYEKAELRYYDESLNPYFCGRCFLRALKMVKPKSFRGLNPYFCGRCFLRR
jgi:ribosomal protein S27AE